ncbi:hypothetical protein Gotur_003965, partial [Gossypium turneri]
MASGENFEFSKDRSTKKVRFNDSNTDGAVDMAQVELGRQRIIMILEMMKRSNCRTGSMDDFEKVLSQGPWIIYGQYLKVQSWTMDFNLMQPYSSVVKAWIRLSSLSDFFYKHRILEECNTPYPRPLP